MTLSGIDSVMLPIGPRTDIWKRVASDLRPAQIDAGGHEVVGLDGVSDALDMILAGKMVGRTLVQPQPICRIRRAPPTECGTSGEEAGRNTLHAPTLTNPCFRVSGASV